MVLRHWDFDTDLLHDGRLEVPLIGGVWDANRLAARVGQAQVEHLATQSGVRGEHIWVDSIANGAHAEVAPLGAIALALTQPPPPSPPVLGRRACSCPARHFGRQQKASRLGKQQAASLKRRLRLGAPVRFLDRDGERFFRVPLLVSCHQVLSHECGYLSCGAYDLHHGSLRENLLVYVVGHRREAVRR